jgi:hypothetical protein
MHAVSSVECKLISKHVPGSVMICLLPDQAIANLADQLETLLAVDTHGHTVQYRVNSPAQHVTTNTSLNKGTMCQTLFCCRRSFNGCRSIFCIKISRAKAGALT